MVLQNYFKTTLRNIAKNKAFTLINVIGLSISMSVGLLMLTFIREVNQYDTFHDNQERIYRINNVFQYLDEDPGYFASTSILAGKKVKEEVGGIEALTIIKRGLTADLQVDDKTIPLTGFYASSDFFDIFSFQMLAGDPSTALDGLNNAVLTQDAALKLFGDEDALGKTVIHDENSYTITGLVEDPPFNSHIDFEIIVSFATVDEQNQDNNYWLSWKNMWMNHVYMLLEEGVEAEDLKPALAKISATENANHEHTNIDLELQALADVTPGPDLSNQIGKTISSEMTYMLGALAFIVIISACFNYTNLSIARSLRRAKEVGIRKVVGATTGHVFSQFLVEAVIVSLLALVFSLAIFFLIKPYFLQMDQSINQMVALELSFMNLFQFVALAIFTGVLAGILPASIFSKFSPQKVLKGGSNAGVFKGQYIRRALIVIQFALSLVFILAATLEYNQFRHAMSFDLGYSTSNIINVRLQGNDPVQWQTVLQQIPEVEAYASSLMVTSVGSYYGESVQYLDPLDSIDVYYNGVDANYLPLHNHTIIAGNNFVPAWNDSATRQVIVNLELLKSLELGTPEESVGVPIKIGGDEATIVGVIDDFHYGTIHAKIEPFLFMYRTDDFYHSNVKLMPGDLFASYDKLEKAWTKFDPIHPFEAKFYEQSIEDVYSEFAVMVRVIGFLAVIAICIALMGLLGMVMFTTETRLKEISIRKVLGASEQGLVMLLGRGFLLLLLVAAVIAIPVTYYLFDTVVFADIVYRAPIGAFDVLGGALLVMLIALLAVVSQTLGASRTDPAKVLRNE